MAGTEDQKREEDKTSGDFENVSLSAALLAPLSSLMKAQLHGARAFLNFLLQLGYRHVKLDGKGEAVLPDDPKRVEPYNLDFVNEIEIDGEKKYQKISVPALALIPIAPLGVESAEFEYDFQVENHEKHAQVQVDRIKEDEGSGYGEKRPWYLVDDPVSLRGWFPRARSEGEIPAAAEATTVGETKNAAAIHISMKVGRMAIPSGLDKLISSLTQGAKQGPYEPEGNEPSPGGVKGKSGTAPGEAQAPGK
jgi:hypothetical protein